MVSLTSGIRDRASLTSGIRRSGEFDFGDKDDATADAADGHRNKKAAPSTGLL